ncbi:PucR family transcriptional regulator [Aldersonia kunmingensis]|uniref:PucR family transcriptional regulator n=1 Tax=Aldersonia kunmingensis TaxID=408066 RepID=UPI0008371B6B|nr:PucR family transcriptional regulator [Aldersonia kunmingensis]
MDWSPPSPRVRELIRAGAEVALDAKLEWLEELDRASLAANPAIADDPELAAAASRTNRSNLLHWAYANVRDPGAPVSANVGAEPLGIARDLVRRGLDERALDAYRAGQNAAWRRWMEIAFELTADPDELREMLAVSSASISAFIDATLAGIEAQIRRERDELTGGAHARHREVVALILDGAPITRQRAQERLGYRLDQRHTAAVVWTEDPATDARRLDRVADALGRAANTRPLSILASTATRWVWVATSSPLDYDPLHDAVAPHPDIRVAVGRAIGGMDGFRQSHVDAVTTQRMLSRLRSTQQVVHFRDVELVALLTADQERADSFVRDTLGELATAEPELRRTVHTYIVEGCNATKAAERLFTHRNTLLRRISRAQQLLPAPLEGSSVHVAVALEVLDWTSPAIGA